MEIQTAIDLVEYGGVAASVLGAGVVGAAVTYRRLFGRREAATSSDERDIDLSRKLEALSARVERLEACINHLPNADNIIALQ